MYIVLLSIEFFFFPLPFIALKSKCYNEKCRALCRCIEYSGQS